MSSNIEIGSLPPHLRALGESLPQPDAGKSKEVSAWQLNLVL